LIITQSNASLLFLRNLPAKASEMCGWWGAQRGGCCFIVEVACNAMHTSTDCWSSSLGYLWQSVWKGSWCFFFPIEFIAP